MYASAGLTMTMSAPSSMSSAASRRPSSALAGSIWYCWRSPKVGARVGGVAERAVVAARVLHRVGHDRDVLEALGVERGADGGHAAVHHVARGDHVGAGLGVGDGLLGEQLERDVVDDAAARRRGCRSGRGSCTRTCTRR